MAHKILNEMIQLYSDTKDNTIKPDTITYNSVINAYAKRNNPDMAHKVLNK